jgi:hypothetical protein
MIEGMSASYLIGLFGECESSWVLGFSVHTSVVGTVLPRLTGHQCPHHLRPD